MKHLARSLNLFVTRKFGNYAWSHASVIFLSLTYKGEFKFEFICVALNGMKPGHPQHRHVPETF